MSGFISFLGDAELLALASSLLFSGTLVFLRQGMRSGTPLAAVLVINACVSAGGFAGALFRGTLTGSAAAPLLWFTAMGLVGPGVGSIFRMVAVERMGLNRSTLIAASTPIWGILLAIFVLGEEPSPRVILGTMLIVGGVSMLVFEGGEGAGGFRSWFRSALIFPIVASLAYAIAPVFTKLAYAYQQTPMVGLGVSFAAGNFLLFATKPLLPGGGRIYAPRRSLAWFALGGVFNLSAAICFMTALTFGEVSSILPVSRLTPLWVILLSAVFLRRLERLTWLIALAAATVVAGGVMITVSSG